MTAPGDIRVGIADGIATLRLANPARRNAISTLMWKSIAAFAAAAFYGQLILFERIEFHQP
jgi:enoyl-CoA hydratase/carnithine racemase